MRPGSVGGFLVLVGCLLLIVTAAIAAGGGSVSVAGRDPGGLVVTAALALLAAGGVVLGLTGPRPLNGRLNRVGLGLLGIGLLSVLATSGASASSSLIFVYLVGGLVAAIGVVATALGLLRSPGRPRQIAVTFFIGLLLTIASVMVTNAAADSGDGARTTLRLLGAVLAVAGSGAMIVGVASIGLLAIRGTSPGPPASE